MQGITKVAALRVRLTCSDEDDFRNNRVLGMPDSEIFLRSISNLTNKWRAYVKDKLYDWLNFIVKFKQSSRLFI